MSKRKKKKRLLDSRFYRVYFALVAVALIAIVIGTLWLNGALRDYESAQPVHAAEIVARLFEDGDYDALYALDTSAAALSDGDKDFYVQSMTALAQGKRVAWSEAFSANADERRYAVTLDGDKFATFTLVPSGQSTRRGNRLWQLGQVTTNVALKEQESTPTPEAPQPTPTPQPEVRTCVITAPKGYTVTVDGVALNADNARLTEKPMFEEGFLPADVPVPVMVEYAYDTPSPLPEVAVKDEIGGLAPVSHHEDRTYTWNCARREDTGVKQQFAEAVLALGEKLAKFTSQDASKSAVLKDCAEDSPAEQIFENLSNQYYTRHSSISFKDEAISEFHVLSDDCFTCHVSFNFVMKTSHGELTYPTEYTFCIVREKDKGKLYNLLIY